MNNEPLGLPKGSVRAILALGTLLGASLFMFKGVIEFEQFMTMTAAVFAFYFSSKSASLNVKKEEICEE
jgi:hypothetical protein